MRRVFPVNEQTHLIPFPTGRYQAKIYAGAWFCAQQPPVSFEQTSTGSVWMSCYSQGTQPVIKFSSGCFQEAEAALQPPSAFKPTPKANKMIERQTFVKAKVLQFSLHLFYHAENASLLIHTLHISH